MRVQRYPHEVVVPTAHGDRGGFYPVVDGGGGIDAQGGVVVGATAEVAGQLRIPYEGAVVSRPPDFGGGIVESSPPVPSRRSEQTVEEGEEEEDVTPTRGCLGRCDASTYISLLVMGIAMAGILGAILWVTHRSDGDDRSSDGANG